MSDQRVRLRECIELHASSASREARARENAVEIEEGDDNRSETVGAAIESAAITTTDQARQDAAPVSIYTTHDLAHDRPSPRFADLAIWCAVGTSGR